MDRDDAPEPRSPAPPDPSAAAFFDIDNTVMRGSSVYHFARGLFQRKIITMRHIVRFGYQQARFVIGGTEDLGHMAGAVEAALAFVRGRRVEEITALTEEIFDEIMADKIWPGTRALTRTHLDAGQRVWLVSAAPIEVARVIADRMGLTGALGTVSEIVGGQYTGRLVGPPLHGSAKADAVRALAAREGLDLARCAAYSDSANDVPLLTLVGAPCAINPDKRLRGHAKAHGWRVRDFRTGRTAARIGLPAAAGAGAVAGVVSAGLAVLRRRRG